MRQEHPDEVLTAWQQFLTGPLIERLAQGRSASPEEAALALFRSVAASVPAYQAFLEAQEISPETIRTFADFQTLPLITKENYILCHPLADLCRGGRIEACDMIAVSSGSTGQPTFWPRSLVDELDVATRFEQVFQDSFHADTRRTLAVVCFPLGTWVGGMYTANCCRHLAGKGYPLTVITPGNNKAEIFRAVEALGPAFEQVVLLGYPPFVKDVLDSGLANGLDWKPYHIKLVFAGEVFSEEWRSLVGERAGADAPCWDSASLYGTADAGVLGNETPLSICIRRFLADHPAAARALFGESRLPTLVQYDPFSRFFETQEGTLLFSGSNGIPLVRYHISDTGGTVSYEAMLQFLREWGFDPIAELSRPGTGAARGIYPLPFVYVFGRSHFIVSYFGANVYPENITVGLEQPGIRDWVTGKFVLMVREEADQNRRLCVVVETAPTVTATPEREKAIASSIQTHLVRLNSEFAHYVPAEYAIPEVTLVSTGDPTFFPPGVKHRYTR